MRHLGNSLAARLLRDFLALEAAGGVVMIAAATLALLLANSPLSALYHEVITAPLALDFDVSSFTGDVLMVLFFFAVGLELKHEMREGALAEKSQRILPFVAALGGIVVPAIMYLMITQAHPEYRIGWAIPTATDIAFALCVLQLLGKRVPQSAKVFLLALAIYDDLAAISIIAIAYSNGVAALPFAIVATLTLALYALNRLHVRHLAPYLTLGIALWFAIHQAGIHPTIAGVITAVFIPLRERDGKPLLAPLLRHIHPSVAFGVLPLFAFTAAGVDLRDIPLHDVFSALPMGIALALFIGKPLGILVASFTCVKLRVATLPADVCWRTMYGIATIAGVGFTMSLFIGALAFSPTTQDAVKIGVLAGSLLSSLWGAMVLVTAGHSTK